MPVPGPTARRPRRWCSSVASTSTTPSGATTRAGAAAARSTRSATGPEPGARVRAPDGDRARRRRVPLPGAPADALRAAERQRRADRHGRAARERAARAAHRGRDRRRRRPLLRGRGDGRPPARPRRRSASAVAARRLRRADPRDPPPLPGDRGVRDDQRPRGRRGRPARRRPRARRRRTARHGQPHARIAELPHGAERQRDRHRRGARRAHGRPRDPARARDLRPRHGPPRAPAAGPRPAARGALRQPAARLPQRRSGRRAGARRARRRAACRHDVGRCRLRRLPAPRRRAGRRHRRPRAHGAGGQPLPRPPVAPAGRQPRARPADRRPRRRRRSPHRHTGAGPRAAAPRPGRRPRGRHRPGGLMQLVVTATALTAFGGSESYAATVADHLQRLGHDVWLTSTELGEAAQGGRDLGLRVVGPGALPPAPGAILSQDGAFAYELAASHPSVPQVFVAHSDTFDLSLPPAVAGTVQVVVTLYDRVDRRVAALATDHRVVRLSQPVDVERFKPTRALPPRPRVALSLGNYVNGPRAELLRRACERAGITLRHVGGYGDEGQTRQPEHLLNEVDVVFGKARVAAEAMACARAVYVYDHNGGEGWVTAANRAALAADNFGGQSAPIQVTEDRLVADLERYDPVEALANRDFIVAHHAAHQHAAALAGLLREVAGASPVRADAPLQEMGRLVRLYHRADIRAFLLQADNSALVTRVHAAEADAAAARADAQAAATSAAAQAERADAAVGRADAAVGRARAAEERAAAALDAERLAWSEAERHAAATRDAEAAFRAVAHTRRWQAVNRVLGPADRLRRLRRGRPGA